jgi:hypothetical protein
VKVVHRLIGVLAGEPKPDPDIGQPYLLGVPFGVDLVERDGWRFALTFDADVAAAEPDRIAAFARKLAKERVGVIAPQDDGRTILTRGLISTERMEAAAIRAWTAVGGRIEPAREPPPDR